MKTRYLATMPTIPFALNECRVIAGMMLEGMDRKEIKDVMSYLSVLNNPNDAVRLARIINEPKRGIGDATVAACREISDGLGISMLEVMRTADENASNGLPW